MKIGILGMGYVGSAVHNHFKNFFEIYHYDLDKNLANTESLNILVSQSELIFICLPTPMKKNGSSDITIVEKNICQIDKICADLSKNIQLIVKSTMPPGSVEIMNSLVDNCNIIFNPEFLTEQNFKQDFINQDRIIIGNDGFNIEAIKRVYSKSFPTVPLIETTSKTAEMIKYVTNTFLALKVAYANEISNLCSRLNIDYDALIEYSILDKRLGDTHWKVPGPDGKKGFGGSCFPKDINALIFLANQIGENLELLEKAWDINLKYRPEKDWEELKGRAVTESDL